jgi:hypothetical protein
MEIIIMSKMIKKCGICGEKKECKEILKDTFTDLDNLKSKSFCKKCIKLFDNKWLKTSFYWTAENKKTIKQNDFEKILLNLEYPCLLSFSESRKKHRLFRSKWTYFSNEIYISTDYGEEILNKHDLYFFKYLLDFYKNNKISKSWLLEGFPTGFIEKIGFEKYFKFCEKAKFYKGTLKYKLLVNFLNK